MLDQNLEARRPGATKGHGWYDMTGGAVVALVVAWWYEMLGKAISPQTPSRARIPRRAAP